MRPIAFILSLFILVLSIVPCSDDENCNEQSIELSSDHSDHDHEEDSCTPFCTCSCCGSAGLILSAPIIHVAMKEISSFTPASTTHKSDFISNYFYTIWQPPKI